MDHFVARVTDVAHQVAAAQSRRAFLGAVADFERLLTVTLEYPRSSFTTADEEALLGLADAVVNHIEHRVTVHGDRPAVERQLVGAIYRIRRELEAIHTKLAPEPADTR